VLQPAVGALVEVSVAVTEAVVVSVAATEVDAVDSVVETEVDVVDSESKSNFKENTMMNCFNG